MDEVGNDTLKDFFSAYAGKKIFITGHTGFKGTWLTYILKMAGAKITGYSLPLGPSQSHFRILGLPSLINHIEGDVRDSNSLLCAIRDAQPEFVFHLAAQPLVNHSYSDPLYTFETNIMGSANLLEAVSRCESVRSLVFITSDKCYENLEWVWGYRESDMLGGRDPYSASKAAAEIIFSSYARSFFIHRNLLGCASARAGNVIGGGDWAEDRIVPDCIRSITRGDKIHLRNPKATRPWQHVLEPISGYLLLGLKLREDPTKFSGSWNFGPSTLDIRTVHDVASSIVKYLGRGEIEINLGQNGPHEANLLQLNCDKANHLLKWQSRWGVEKTLETTATWYKVFINGGDVAITTKKQLEEYFSRQL